MTVLSAQTIRKRGIVTPFCERSVAHGMSYGLSIAGYDISIAQSLWVAPHGCALASTIEHIDMPLDVIARVADKSTWARQFLCVQNTIFEPGWRGYPTIELTNHTAHGIHVLAGMPIAQRIFELVDEP